MLLSGQDAPVYGVKFSPNGDVLASAGAEKAIYLWEVYGDCAGTTTSYEGTKTPS